MWISENRASWESAGGWWKHWHYMWLTITLEYREDVWRGHYTRAGGMGVVYRKGCEA